ncbi:hypothetical protein [Frondihabitans peucedani]|uniref:Glycosyltransferase involved in cell wall biosynthesis n=1 Tax=Frondihabitans peucedani TaxID=598626 RepID=A0ABP8DZG9_9MICO
MNTTKLRRLLADLLRVNGRYLRDDVYRNTIRERLNNVGVGSHAIEAREVKRSPRAARPFRGLVETSLALSGIDRSGGGRHVNIVLGEVREGGAFAGIQTAVAVGVALASELGLPVRVVMVSWTTPGNSSKAAAAVLRERFPGVSFEVVAREEILRASFGEQDVWLATHWKTAHAIDVAATSGVIDRARVGYLVQDFEPGFSPWSTEFALARATYHAGFRLLVNSAPLQQYLAREEGVEVPDDATFSPHFDLDLLRRVAEERSHDATTRVLFYGRPSKHRNLFRIGVSALQIAVDRLEGSGLTLEFASAGEVHRDVDLGHGQKLESVGTLPWDDYFRFIASRNVVLSLQLSPHPSHPPFDGAISGAQVVTNEFADTRSALHPNIDAVAADPVSLGEAVARAVRRAAADGPTGYRDLAPGALGGSLDDAVAHLARQLQESA